jgi:hypothetical protein
VKTTSSGKRSTDEEPIGSPGTLIHDDGSDVPFKVQFSADSTGWYAMGELERCEATSEHLAIPRDIVLLMDGSSNLTMQGWEIEVKAVRMFLKALKEASANVHLSLILFSGPDSPDAIQDCVENSTKDSSDNTESSSNDTERSSNGDDFKELPKLSIPSEMLRWQRPPVMNCSDYMDKVGCGWTESWSCPGQVHGSEGIAGANGGLGYQCCCKGGMWNQCRIRLVSGYTNDIDRIDWLVRGLSYPGGSELTHLALLKAEAQLRRDTSSVVVVFTRGKPTGKSPVIGTGAISARLMRRAHLAWVIISKTAPDAEVKAWSSNNNVVQVQSLEDLQEPKTIAQVVKNIYRTQSWKVLNASNKLLLRVERRRSGKAINLSPVFNGVFLGWSVVLVAATSLTFLGGRFVDRWRRRSFDSRTSRSLFSRAPANARQISMNQHWPMALPRSLCSQAPVVQPLRAEDAQLLDFNPEHE